MEFTVKSVIKRDRIDAAKGYRQYVLSLNLTHKF